MCRKVLRMSSKHGVVACMRWRNYCLRNNEFDYNHLCGFVLQILKGGIISSYEEITDIFNPIMCMPWCKSPTSDIAY